MSASSNLAAFAVVLAVQRERRSVDRTAFRGLGRAHPWWTAVLVLALLSLLGLPPLAGFVGKLEVFRAAIDAGQAWLAVVAVVNTVISLYPYLRVIAPAVREAGVEGEEPRRRAAPPLAWAALASTAGVVLIGIAAQPLLAVAEQARALAGG